MIAAAIVIFAVYAVISVIISAVIGDSFYTFMAWNLFLALIPLIAAEVCSRLYTRKKVVLSILCAAVWLLFFPNAPYMLTDFIHLHLREFYTVQEGVARYSRDISDWVTLVHIGGGEFVSHIFGLYSLNLMHKIVNERFSKAAGAVMIATVSLLSGFAIYMGRVVRVNSWDVLHPFSLLGKMVLSLDSFSAAYALMFGAYIGFSYIVYRIFIRYASQMNI